MIQATGRLLATDKSLHLAAVIHRWILGLLAPSRATMALKLTGLQAPRVAAMENGILGQPQTAEVKGDLKL